MATEHTAHRGQDRVWREINTLDRRAAINMPSPRWPLRSMPSRPGSSQDHSRTRRCSPTLVLCYAR
ncbi:hypothetical protein N7481_002266 [Penicillium waksmanii]|uniref:uncharacterized protein n=1 Tax=Penicillium waksmanii TaxID=69791 RepID=UPI0025471E6E|nr:uncharacterized protein N7481_002266 [Penicillium waksmanii]KAJ5995289.1 hypothetical protein N7481_002266 [Penicillium waksmanii]